MHYSPAGGTPIRVLRIFKMGRPQPLPDYPQSETLWRTVAIAPDAPVLVCSAPSKTTGAASWAGFCSRERDSFHFRDPRTRSSAALRKALIHICQKVVNSCDSVSIYNLTASSTARRRWAIPRVCRALCRVALFLGCSLRPFLLERWP